MNVKFYNLNKRVYFATKNILQCQKRYHKTEYSFPREYTFVLESCFGARVMLGTDCTSVDTAEKAWLNLPQQWGNKSARLSVSILLQQQI
jgi:hypothetical protein